RGGAREVRRPVSRARRKSGSARGRLVAQAPGAARVRQHGAGAQVVPLAGLRAAHQAAPEGLARQAGRARGPLKEKGLQKKGRLAAPFPPLLLTRTGFSSSG